MGYTAAQISQSGTEVAPGRKEYNDAMSAKAKSENPVKVFIRSATETIEKYPLYAVAALTVVVGIIMMVMWPDWSKKS